MYKLALSWLALLAILGFGSPWLRLSDPTAVDLNKALTPPGTVHIAGTDELGRDVLSRLLHAAQSTLVIVFGAASAALFCATLLGGLAGYLGGWFDRAVRICVDLLWSVPFVVFVVLILSVVGVSVPSLIVTIAIINWVGPARVIRNEVVRLREADFMIAARAYGYSRFTALVQELLPNLKHTLLTLAAYGAIEVLTLETGLAFLGLSLPAPKPTWGGMLADGLGYFSSAWWIIATTAAVVTATLGALQIVARKEESVRQV